MNTLSSLSGSELLKRTQDLVADERRATMDLIEHLREIERRMLFLETGHSSLFEFAVKHLGLSEGSAQRRISAMRLIRDIPEAKAKLESGEISLSNASQIQTVFRASKVAERQDKRSGKSSVQKMSLGSKREILDKVSGMTQRECQAALLELVPDAAPKLMERDRQISEERFELKLVISKVLHEQIGELKSLLSHSLNDGGTSELIEYLVQQELKRQAKKHGVFNESELEHSIWENRSTQAVGQSENSRQQGARLGSTAAPVRNEVNRSRKAIPRSTQREIWRLAKGCCQYPECGSRYRLELDHIVPYAQGGSDSIENLRLYCRAHNLGHAVKTYGTEKMNQYRK
jgi:5-methylcytosine-specific restriction endonuclease McrA